MELVVPARISDEAIATVRELAARVFPRSTAPASPAATSSSATTARCSSTRSTRSPASPRPASSRSCSRPPGSPTPRSATAWSSSPSSVTTPRGGTISEMRLLRHDRLPLPVSALLLLARRDPGVAEVLSRRDALRVGEDELPRAAGEDHQGQHISNKLAQEMNNEASSLKNKITRTGQLYDKKDGGGDVYGFCDMENVPDLGPSTAGRHRASSARSRPGRSASASSKGPAPTARRPTSPAPTARSASGPARTTRATRRRRRRSATGPTSTTRSATRSRSIKNRWDYLAYFADGHQGHGAAFSVCGGQSVPDLNQYGIPGDAEQLPGLGVAELHRRALRLLATY